MRVAYLLVSLFVLSNNLSSSSNNSGSWIRNSNTISEAVQVESTSEVKGAFFTGGLNKYYLNLPLLISPIPVESS
jgi:hypothetical protein